VHDYGGLAIFILQIAPFLPLPTPALVGIGMVAKVSKIGILVGCLSGKLLQLTGGAYMTQMLVEGKTLAQFLEEKYGITDEIVAEIRAKKKK